MLVTKHAAELCALLVNDLYGELPSRIVAALLTKGRSNIAQLMQHTSLSARHVRNGLGVLLQHNLLYHHTEPDSSGTSYDANPDACYSLARSGRILDVVEGQFGGAERDLVQMLMLLGHARVADLSQAVESRSLHVNGQTNGSHGPSSRVIDSQKQLHTVLRRLIHAEIIEPVRPESFRNPDDVFHEIQEDVRKTAPGEKSTKTKTEQQNQILDRVRAYRDENKLLKRQLDQDGGSPAKRRKLENGRGAHEGQGLPHINANVVLRVNHEKCLVELRNDRLAGFAADALGEGTGDVYRTVLGLLTEKLSRCRSDRLLDEGQLLEQATVTTLQVYDHLKDSINVAAGIGRAPRDKIDVRSAERIIASVPTEEGSDSEDSDGPPVARGGVVRTIESDDDDDDSEESDDEAEVIDHRTTTSPRVNGERLTKVKFDDEAAPKDSRLNQMRQHLLLLAEGKHRFIRHCGAQGRGQWTVDFKPLMDRLREAELDAVIEQSFGRHGLRLTRILREKGKLDEKMLPSAALMKKSDVQGKMLAMQMAGLVDVQEVPKDSSRLANRTLFFWFFDGERTQSQLLDDIYKAMLRCLQTLEVERHRERSVLSFVERKDVKGREEEVMTAEHYNKYNQHLEVQEKLLGQVMRLDDVVAVLRDY